MPDLWTAYNSGEKVYDEDMAEHVTEMLARVRLPNKSRAICIVLESLAVGIMSESSKEKAFTTCCHILHNAH